MELPDRLDGFVEHIANGRISWRFGPHIIVELGKLDEKPRHQHDYVVYEQCNRCDAKWMPHVSDVKAQALMMHLAQFHGFHDDAQLRRMLSIGGSFAEVEAVTEFSRANSEVIWEAQRWAHWRG